MSVQKGGVVKPQLPEGAKVRFYHERNYEEDGSLSPLGGTTTARVTLANGREYWGVASCSNKDTFCKRIGRDISLGRALHGRAHVSR